MRQVITLCLFSLALFAGPARGQEALERLRGSFGSASDAASSCAANPHELAIIDDRPHLARIWTLPYTGEMGGPRLREVYDLEAFDGRAMTLTEEEPYRDDPDGIGKPWVLQFTNAPDGYCWRRPDWPVTRCEDQQLRCLAPTS